MEAGCVAVVEDSICGSFVSFAAFSAWVDLGVIVILGRSGSSDDSGLIFVTDISGCDCFFWA